MNRADAAILTGLGVILTVLWVVDVYYWFIWHL